MWNLIWTPLIIILALVLILVGLGVWYKAQVPINQGPPGPQGIQGIQGPAGPAGANGLGTLILSASILPSASVMSGDTVDLYKWTHSDPNVKYDLSAMVETSTNSDVEVILTVTVNAIPIHTYTSSVKCPVSSKVITHVSDLPLSLSVGDSVAVTLKNINIGTIDVIQGNVTLRHSIYTPLP